MRAYRGAGSGAQSERGLANEMRPLRPHETVRGESSYLLKAVAEEWAASDGRALRDFLGQLGAVSGTITSRPSQEALVTTLDAVEVVRSDRTGIVMHLKPLGTPVKKGECVARFYDAFTADPARRWSDIVVENDGVIFARWHQRVIQAGMALVKIAGWGVARAEGQARLLD